MRPEEIVELADGLYHDTEFAAPRAWLERNHGKQGDRLSSDLMLRVS